MPYAIYILKCSDNTYYTGLTKDLEARVYEHQIGAHPESYTFGRRPVKLVWSEVTESYQEAFSGSIKSKAGVAPRKKPSSVAISMEYMKL